MLPAKLPVISGLSIGCFSIPAENVCGDYYDILVSRKDRISFPFECDLQVFGVNISLYSRFFNLDSGFPSFFPQQEKQGLSIASSGLRMPRAWAIMHMRAMTG